MLRHGPVDEAGLYGIAVVDKGVAIGLLLRGIVVQAVGLIAGRTNTYSS